ncbi:MAG: metallophosphoesterase family protein [Micrococcaceae bacterium]
MALNKPTKVLTGIALTGTGLLGYSNVIERRNFALRFGLVPILQEDAKPITILHISDLHMVENQQWKEKWVRSLAKYEPDFVVNTGDNFSSVAALDIVKSSMDPFLDTPGSFVAGTNDLYSPSFRNPAKYLFAPSNQHKQKQPYKEPDLPFEELFGHFKERGWFDLVNAQAEIELNGSQLQFTGVGDPHANCDTFVDYPDPDNKQKIKIGVLHAPYQRVLNQFTAAGSQLILAGHTHGGQLRIPGYGAIVANCDIPLDKARGLTTWNYAGNESYLNVSAGLGNSRYFPFRFGCRPEASLLTLVPRTQNSLLK